MSAVIRRTASSRLALMAGGLGVGLFVAPAVAGLVLAPRTGEGRPPAEDPNDPGAARFLAALERAREGNLEVAREHLVAAVAAGVFEAPSHLAEVDRRLAAEAAVVFVRGRLAAGDSAGAAAALAGAAGALEFAPLADEVRAHALRHGERLAAAAAGEGDAAAEARAELARLAAAFPGEPGFEVPRPGLPRSTGDANANRALSALRGGRLGEARTAVADCRSARCRSIEEALATVEAALSDRSATGRWPALEVALATVRRLGGGGAIEKALGEELAPWYHAAGIEALGRGDVGAARERFDRAIAARPGYSPAMTERDRLRERARQAFLAGYTEKDASPAEARQKFRLVTTITGPDEDVHRKARRWLELLDGGREGGPARFPIPGTRTVEGAAEL